ncbi:MAG: MerR family transcriptional regulator [Deferrisomatales bacterium]
MGTLKDYLQIKEAAALLGVAPNTLRTWSAKGKIPTHRNPANGYRLYRREDLVAFLAATLATATTEGERGDEA